MAIIKFRARLAFLHLWTPTQVNGGAFKYRAVALMDPTDKRKLPGAPVGLEAIKLIRATRIAVAKEKWGKKSDAILEAIKGDKKQDSYWERDKLNGEGDPYDGCEGMFHMSLLADEQPTILDVDKTELTKKDGKPYGGCWGVVHADIWAQDNSSGKGMRAGLAGLQFWKDSERFGGGAKAKLEDFDDLSDTGEDEEDEDEAPPPKSKPKAKARPPVEEDDDDDIA